MRPDFIGKLTLATTAALTLFAAAPAQALTFALTDLGIAPGFDFRTITLGYGLNADGDVIGQIGTNQYTQTALWSAPPNGGSRRAATYVAPPAGGANSVSYQINRGDQFVGTFGGGAFGGGNLAGVNRGGTWAALPVIGTGLSIGRAYAINDAGTIVGQDAPANYGFPLRWQPDGNGGYTAQRLNGLGGGGIARDINASGQMVGASNEGALLGPSHAVLWQADNTVTDLGVLGATANHSEARALNDNGVVVGASRNAQGNKLEAFRWSGGTMSGLGAIPGWETYPFLNTVSDLSDARDVNNLGWVVGSALRGDGKKVGYLWRDGVGMVDLNTLISLSDPWFADPTVFDPSGLLITSAEAANDSGQILVTAIYNYRYAPGNAWQVTHGFLLTPDALPPVPEPATWALLGMGLGLLAWRRRSPA